MLAVHDRLPAGKRDIHEVFKAIIKGDSKIEAISAASILAKVYRDQQMIELDEQYPEYHFKKHKGYPTKLHLEKLQQYGPLPVHRMSFGPVKKACLADQAKSNNINESQ